jgi:phosphoenolpyruvate-protein kinase (PTS system EI component)
MIKKLCRPNHLIRGVGNGVYSIVNNIAVRVHVQSQRVVLVERKIEPAELSHQLERIEKLRTRFAPAAGLESYDAFCLVANEVIGKTVELVKSDLLNPEGALHRVMDGQRTALQAGLKRVEDDAQALRTQIYALSHDGVQTREKYAELDRLDGELNGSWSFFQRQKAFLGDFTDLMDRMVWHLQAYNGEQGEAAVVHVADNLSWREIVNLHAAGAKGFILNSDKLGPINHPFIFAHNNGIPLVVIADPLKTIDATCRVSIDSRTGHVIINPTESTVNGLDFRRKGYQQLTKLFKEHAKPYQSLDGQKLPALQVNIKDRHDFEKIAGQEVGLFRTEGLYSDGRPAVQTLIRVFKDAIRKASVINLRLFDLAADKVPDFLAQGTDPAPLRYSLDFLLNTESGRSILTDQIKALLIAQDRLQKGDKDELSGKKVRLIIPMVSSPNEVQQIKMVIAQTQNDLIARQQISGPVSKTIELGAMIETAAAVANLERLADEVAYFSIGGNDLTRDLLGFAERKLMMTGKQYDWLSPVVLSSLQKIITVARQKGVGVGSCGEISRDPMAAIILTLLGIDSLSMDEAFRREINYVLTHIHLDEWSKFAALDLEGLPVTDRLQKMQDAQEVREYLFALIRDKAHADTKVALEGVITSAVPLSYLAADPI